MRARAGFRVGIVGMLLSALVVAVPGSATATISPKCGGNWTKTASCQLSYAGDHFTVNGSFSGGTVGYVHVVLEARGSDGAVTELASCRAAVGFGFCNTDAWGKPGGLKLTAGQTLYCRVEGEESGSYSCSSQAS